MSASSNEGVERSGSGLPMGAMAFAGSLALLVIALPIFASPARAAVFVSLDVEPPGIAKLAFSLAEFVQSIAGLSALAAIGAVGVWLTRRPEGDLWDSRLTWTGALVALLVVGLSVRMEMLAGQIDALLRG